MSQRTIVLFGDVTDDDVLTVTELALGRGFTVVDGAGHVMPEVMVNALANEYVAAHPLPLPTWQPDRLASVKLPDAIPSRLMQQQVTSILAIDKISNAAQLTERTFSGYLRPQNGLSAHFRARAIVVEFMALNGIPFKDLNPVAALRTKIVDIPELNTMQSALLSRGIFRLEMLAFVTPEDLMRSGLIKTRRIEILREMLHSIGLTFRGGY